MERITRLSQTLPLILTAGIACTGCSNTLIKDYATHSIEGTAHCSGTEWADDSSLAIMPVPVVAFLSPRLDLNDIKADDYLRQCGDNTKLINRKVEVGRGACIPASLTYLVSLGIWQWCPAQVSWEADVRS